MVKPISALDTWKNSQDGELSKNVCVRLRSLRELEEEGRIHEREELRGDKEGLSSEWKKEYWNRETHNRRKLSWSFLWVRDEIMRR